MTIPELANDLEPIEDVRRQSFGLYAEAPVPALNWRPIERTDDRGTNSLAVLGAHVAGAAHFWIAEVKGDRVIDPRHVIDPLSSPPPRSR